MYRLTVFQRKRIIPAFLYIHSNRSTCLYIDRVFESARYVVNTFTRFSFFPDVGENTLQRRFIQHFLFPEKR